MKTILDYPPQFHLRRARLYESLEALGFTRHDVDNLIDAGTIKPKHIPHPRRVRASKKTRKTTRSVKPKPAPANSPTLIKGRAYYVAAEVITALNLNRSQSTVSQ